MMNQMFILLLSFLIFYKADVVISAGAHLSLPLTNREIRIVQNVKVDDSMDDGLDNVIQEPAKNLIDLWKTIVRAPYSHLFNASTSSTPFSSTLQALRNDSSLMPRQLAHQFMYPQQVMAGETRWLDPHFVVHIKGLAALSSHPHLISSKGRTFLPPRTRGVQLTGSSTLTASMRTAILDALAGSIQAKCIFVNQESVERLRQVALKLKGISETILTDETLIAALLDLIEQENSPYIIVFDDDLTWLREDRDVSKLFQQDIVRGDSKTFYVVLDPVEDLKNGKPSLNTAKKIDSSIDPQESNEGSSGSSGPNPSFGWPPQNPMASFPPNMQMGRSFQIVMNKNGSMSVNSLPAGMMPQGPFPFKPPDAVMKRIMQEQQSKLYRNQEETKENSNTQSNGKKDPEQVFFPFTPEMSEEEIQEFMKDPNNELILKDVMEKFMSMVTSNLPPGMDKLPDGVDVKVHVMQMPIPTFDNAEEKRKYQSMMMNGKNDSNQSKSRFSRFPGFMRPLSKNRDKENEANEDSGVKKEKKANDENFDIVRLFEKVPITPSSEHSVRSIWEQIIEEDIAKRVKAKNIDTLKAALNAADISYEDFLWDIVEDSLGTQILSKEDAKSIVTIALKNQAASITADFSPSFEDIDVSIKLSPWALDSAIMTITKAPNPKTNGPSQSWGQSSSALSKTELNTLVTDKHERSLLSNVMFPSDIGVSYDMIGGLSDVKELLRQSITYPLKYPRLYREGIANEAVKGVLLFGPPGTGKTMLAKAIATEGGAAFLSIDASSIENKWLGESEKNAKAVFTLARRLAPCVVFIDEVDSLLSSREYGDDSTHGTITSVKTTLMQEWDGLRTTKDRVVVIASTNRPFDLDEAVLRRLPRRIMVDLPDQATRQEILQVTLMHNRLAEDVNITRIAESLQGYSGSDIKEVCREAVVRVSHEKASMLDRGINVQDAKDSSLTSSFLEPLRPVCFNDFKEAMRKLKASVAENSRELQKVIEWNEKYGELKRNKESSRSSRLSMYI